MADHVKCVVLVQRFLAFARHRLTSRCKCILVSGYWNVHSRDIAGRSSAPSGDRYCSLTRNCWPKLRFFQRQEMLYERFNVSVGCLAHHRNLHTSWGLFEKTWIFIGNFINCSCLQWLYDHRSLLLTISQWLGVLETLVDCSMFVTVDKYLWRWTPAYGVSSAYSSSSIVCQHITLDGSIRRTFQPRAGVNFVLKWWKCTSKRAQQFLFVILMGT